MVKQSRNKGIIAKGDIIDALNQAQIPNEEYSIDGYCESCLCIEAATNGWEVYHGERGVKHNTSIHTSLDTLVNEVCDRLGYAKPVMVAQPETDERKTAIRIKIPFQPQTLVSSKPLVAAYRRSTPLRLVLKKAGHRAYRIRTETSNGGISKATTSRQLTVEVVGTKGAAQKKGHNKSKQVKFQKFSKKLGE